MNRWGIMVDVSHVSDKTNEQVLQITRAPVIASHSSCRAFTPGFNRNLSDDLIKKIAKGGGVVQINFGSAFLDSTLATGFMKQRADLLEWSLKNKIAPNSKEYSAYAKEYEETHKFPLATVAQLADHIDHVVKLVGIDYVGFGSDFDGVGDTLPDGIKDVSQYPNLIYVLLKRGYSDKMIEKICYKKYVSGLEESAENSKKIDLLWHLLRLKALVSVNNSVTSRFFF